MVVEIDPTMGKVARDDFGFQEGGNLRLVIADGLEYIANFKGECFSVYNALFLSWMRRETQ